MNSSNQQTTAGPNKTSTSINMTEKSPQIERTMDFPGYDFEDCSQMMADLQLAAELGKTLLERNKELEGALKKHQLVIDDQAQEIEHLTKQTAALREVNDTRLKMYENLEISISDLERSNHRLMIENSNDKKQIKTLCNTIDNLESRCEEMTKQIDELNQIISIERRKKDRLLQENKTLSECAKTDINRKDNRSVLSHQSLDKAPDSNDRGQQYEDHYVDHPDIGSAFKSSDFNAETAESHNNHELSFHEQQDDLEKLRAELEIVRREWMTEQQRVCELEEQLISIIQDNQSLQGRLAQTSTNEEKSIQEELSILEEVRQGQMCYRCLRLVDAAKPNENPMENNSDLEDDDLSLFELINSVGQHQPKAFRNELTIQGGYPGSPKHSSLESNPNSYRLLVQRYEALLEEKKRRNQALGQEENLISSEFSSIVTKEEEEHKATKEKDNAEEPARGQERLNRGARQKVTTRTPTNFSEVSSGFSDETCNKYTQTDERPGSFLCAIADGEDCKFSIYDDASPIDSRFVNKPEYQELFKEIFQVLKKAAENKEEGEKLPLLDDDDDEKTETFAPPPAPAMPDFMVDNTDTQSIASSMISEQSVAMSECITKTERKKKKKRMCEKSNQENFAPSAILVDGDRILKPYKRDQYDFFSATIKSKKRDRKNRRNKDSGESSPSHAALPTPPRFFYGSGRRKREINPFDIPSTSEPKPSADGDWSGNSITIYNRNVKDGHHQPSSLMSDGSKAENIAFKPSTASQEMQKLMKLELTYAEVLRRADQQSKNQIWKKHQQQQQQQQPTRQNKTNSNQQQQHPSQNKGFYQRK